MKDFREESPPLHDLLLDPNNYRFHDEDDFVMAEEARFHENSVQTRAYRRLRDNGLIQLKNSILKNGFLPVERIVVRQYPSDASRFVVIEGNRRVAALRWINEDHDAGVEVPEEILQTISEVPVLVVEGAHADAAFIEALMGVRHVSGIKEWGGYQRAKLVSVLRDERAMESAEIAERLGMQTQEVNRRYRAYKALEQMQSDDDYGSYAAADLYPVFHEAVSLPVVRKWLGWDDTASRFTDEEALGQFYGLITPGESDDAAPTEPKMTTYSQVRNLRDILPNAEAKRLLLNPSRTFLEALTMAKRDEFSQVWKSQVAEAITALKSIGALDLKKMPNEDVAVITKLRDSASELLEAFSKLQS